MSEVVAVMIVEYATTGLFAIAFFALGFWARGKFDKADDGGGT